MIRGMPNFIDKTDKSLYAPYDALIERKIKRATILYFEKCYLYHFFFFC